SVSPPRLPRLPYTTLFRSCSAPSRGGRHGTTAGPRAIGYRHFGHLCRALSRRLHLTIACAALRGFEASHLVLGHDGTAPYLIIRDRKSTRLNSSHSQISYA